ncbi:MAG: hypothetical protein [Edwardsiella phage MSW-3]|nr:MAG: hypothetical protein [Edwardsiella phage MSW-3]
MKPCEKLRYKVGDKFVVVQRTDGSRSTVGDILTLERDDGSIDPIFSKENCRTAYCPDLPNIVKLEGDGWVGWKGGEMPVDSEMLVDVVYRGGGKNTRNKKANQYYWGHAGGRGDIVAYRPLQVEQSAPSTLVELLQAWEKAKANLKNAEQVAAEQPLNITDWRDLKVGDVIWWSGDAVIHAGEYPVSYVERPGYEGTVPIGVDTGDITGWVCTGEQWRFIRRP